MATPPQVCNTIEFEGAIFQRCNLQVVRGTTVAREISFVIQISQLTTFHLLVDASIRTPHLF